MKRSVIVPLTSLIILVLIAGTVDSGVYGRFLAAKLSASLRDTGVIFDCFIPQFTGRTLYCSQANLGFQGAPAPLSFEHLRIQWHPLGLFSLRFVAGIDASLLRGGVIGSVGVSLVNHSKFTSFSAKDLDLAHYPGARLIGLTNGKLSLLGENLVLTEEKGLEGTLFLELTGVNKVKAPLDSLLLGSMPVANISNLQLKAIAFIAETGVDFSEITLRSSLGEISGKGKVSLQRTNLTHEKNTFTGRLALSMEGDKALGSVVRSIANLDPTTKIRTFTVNFFESPSRWEIRPLID